MKSFAPHLRSAKKYTRVASDQNKISWLHADVWGVVEIALKVLTMSSSPSIGNFHVDGTRLWEAEGKREAGDGEVYDSG